MTTEAPLRQQVGNPETTAAWLNIPSELRDRKQWVVWKHDKVPYNPRSHDLASTKDPSTWSSFGDAVTACHNGMFKGIGFVFTAADPFVGVDLDHCRNPDTGAIEPWAKSIVDPLDSYTEISQSGTGLHVFVKGNLPGKKRKKSVPGGGALEMYDSGRYFTMTGNRLDGTPEEINDRNDQIQTLYRKFFGDDQAPVKGKKPG